jgi:hypothetical protein
MGVQIDSSQDKDNLINVFKDILKNKRLGLPQNDQDGNPIINLNHEAQQEIQDEFEKLQQILPPVCKPHQGVIISSKPHEEVIQIQKQQQIVRLSQEDGLESHLPEKRVITFNLDNPPSDTCANVANIRIAGGLYLRVRFYNDGRNSMTTTGFPKYPQDFAFEDSKGTIRKISDVLDDDNQIKVSSGQLNNDLQTAINQAMNPGVQPYNITQQTEMQELGSALIDRAKNLDLEIQTTITQLNGTTATQNIFYNNGIVQKLPQQQNDRRPENFASREEDEVPPPPPADVWSLPPDRVDSKRARGL